MKLLEAEAKNHTDYRCECNEQRRGYCSGHYNRNLTTTNVTLKVSRTSKEAFENEIIERYRLLQGGRYPYVYVDGIYLCRNYDGEFGNVAILVAIAVNEDGYPEVLGAVEKMKEDKVSRDRSLPVAE